MAKRINFFWAYPSNPADIGETISTAIGSLRTRKAIRDANVQFKPWPDLKIAGRNLARTITENIARSDVFACDLTYPNRNVSFELGYAIATHKRIFPTLNRSIDGADREYRRLFFNLLGLAYLGYDNSRELAAQLETEAPWNSLDKVLLHDRYRTPFARPEFPMLLYVKPQIDTDSTIATHEALIDSVFSQALMIDDPIENPSPSLDWYADQILGADAVLIHLLSKDQIGQEHHNIKASFVAGFAYGFKRPVLMLAHEPFDSPVDYEQLLKKHTTARSCATEVKVWLDKVGADLPRRRSRRPTSTVSGLQRLNLRTLSIGQTSAEQEKLTLDQYFIPTQAYYRALEGPTTIMVGRRGTGKTANLYAIQSELLTNRRNHVTVISPPGYEMHGLLRILSEMQYRSERGYLIESLWKYLIFSEIGASVEKSLKERPAYQQETEEEILFLQYCESYPELIRLPFSERLSRALVALEGVESLGDATTQRARISEALHDSLIRDLRGILGRVLRDKDKVAILIDNLDKPWEPGDHIDLLADLLSGLLAVVEDIPATFQRANYRNDPVNTVVSVLLRSDIFSFIHPHAVEQDKLPIERVYWDNPEMLLRVLDERLLQHAPRDTTAQDIWSQLFPQVVVGVPCTDFILRTTLPRPRDVIYLLTQAIGRAINRGADSVTEADLLYARDQYSEWVFRSVLSEDDPQRGKLQSVLYEFAGAPKELSKPDVSHRMNIAGVDDNDVEYHIDLLCDIGFLAIGTLSGYRYARHEGDRETLRQVAKRVATNSSGEERFELNPAFYQVLQIE